jgi:UDP-3-O-[3-hydroxymyristoyl] glucosamine N-acyltransferase
VDCSAIEVLRLFFLGANVYKGAMKRSVKEIAQFLEEPMVGDGAVEITGIASIKSASPGDLVFVEDEKNLESAIRSHASAIIGQRSQTGPVSKPLILSAQPRLAFARAAEFLSPSSRHEGHIHETAVIHPSVKIGENVRVEAHVSIDENTFLGENTRIGAGCRIGGHVRIGADCNLAANVTIYPGVSLGDRVIVHAGAVLGSDGFGYVRDENTGKYIKFPQVGRLEIEDEVEIGANTTVDRGALDVTRISRRTKIDNLVHVGHNVQIGKDVVIAAQTGLSGSAVIENGVVIAGQVGIADHVRIESGAILGAQCGVPSKKVIRGKGVLFWGTPARPIREYLKELAVLARLARKA